ncbi:MAG: sigma-70 family RNA polymerase sigma factor [Clostridiaceae bacterium]|nr:sigma-70 family RNA polymerase sigma factor [Clostridiaceae bacterium]
MYETYKNLVYRISVIYLGNTFDAEDLVQNVFVSYYKRLPKFESQEHARNWFARVTVNMCINFRKSYWRRFVDKADEIDVPENMNVERIEILDILSVLPDKSRLIMLLYYYEQYTVGDIAGIMNMSESAIKMQLKRSREKLKEVLGDE